MDISKIGDFAAKRATEKYTRAKNAPDYKDFFAEAFNVLEPGTRYIHNWHVDYMCDRLQEEMDRIARGDPKMKGDIIINIMPRSLKSYIVTILLNAWAWIKYPHFRFITLSYSAPLSEEHSYKTRNFIKSDWYQDNYGHLYNLSSSQDAKKYFTNNKGGERKASSVGGQLTGSGANVLIFDDPVKPPKEGELGVSEVEIREANSWHDSTAYNRVNDPVVDVRIYVMQRLHNNDMTGHLINKKNQKYDWICIPGELNDTVRPKYISAYYKEDDKRPHCKLFFKERFPKDVLLTYEENMGDNYSGQVDQMPQKKGGGMWRLDYFIPISRDELPVRYGKKLTAWDLATSKKQKKSNSASAYVYGFRVGEKIYITDFGYVWKDFPRLIEYIMKKEAPHWIENKSAGKDAVPTLKDYGIEAYEYPNENMDKFQHAAFASAKAKRLQIYVLDEIWDELLGDNDKGKEQGVCNFPNAIWDDVHDAFCTFISKISEGMISKEDVEKMVNMNRTAVRGIATRGRAGFLMGTRGGSFRGNSI